MKRQGSKMLREERKQSESSLGGYVHTYRTVWLGASPGPSQLSWNRWSGEAERSIAQSGGTRRREGASAVADEGGLAVAWQEFVIRMASLRDTGVWRYLTLDVLPAKIGTN